MTVSPRPSWLYHLALACAAMVCVLLAGASMADRLLGPTQHVADTVGSDAFRVQSSQPVPAVIYTAPIDRASTRLASNTRAPWQRGAGRRGQRTASSQISGVERALGPIGRSAYDRGSSAPTVTRFHVSRRDGRLGSAPTRAPPNHR